MAATVPGLGPCRVCGLVSEEVLLQRIDVPTMQNGFHPTAAAGEAASRGNIHLVGCGGCDVVVNIAFDERLVTYDLAYENDQSCSQRFASHLEAMARRVVERVPGQFSAVEVACGQGNFVRLLAEVAGDRARWIAGFDPAARAPVDGRLCVVAGMYDETAAALLGELPDVIVARHVIEHMHDPVGFLAGLRGLLRPDAGGRLFLETPSAEWITERGVFFDVFYEHCNYFSPAALANVIERAGFVVEGLTPVFGGQYLWAEATPSLGADGGGVRPSPAGFAGWTELAHLEARVVAEWRARLADAPRPVIVWGAGAKGVTFVNLVDPGRSLVDVLVDVNPAKQGGYVPGTGHAVVAWDDVEVGDAGTVVIMNPNYSDEIAAAVTSRNRAGGVRMLQCE